MTDHSLHTDLFSPTQLGGLSLANRFVMAPLTRSRAGDDGVPTELHATYYAQRASAGLLISEAVNISAQGRGYNLTPASGPRSRSPAGRRSPTPYMRPAARSWPSCGTWAATRT